MLFNFFIWLLYLPCLGCLIFCLQFDILYWKDFHWVVFIWLIELFIIRISLWCFFKVSVFIEFHFHILHCFPNFIHLCISILSSFSCLFIVSDFIQSFVYVFIHLIDHFYNHPFFLSVLLFYYYYKIFIRINIFIIWGGFIVTIPIR
jgi:hypothetical protein